MYSPVSAFNVDVKNPPSLLDSGNFKGRYGTSKRGKIKKNTLYIHYYRIAICCGAVDINVDYQSKVSGSTQSWV